MLTSDFYILCFGHLVFVSTKVYVTKILVDNTFFPKLWHVCLR